MSELRQKQKQKQIREKKVLKKEEVYHGALEDILLGMGLHCCVLHVFAFFIMVCLALGWDMDML